VAYIPIRFYKLVSSDPKSFVLLSPTSTYRRTGFQLGSHVSQFTNLRNLTLFTKPSIRNTDHVLDPPELISGRGIPVIGIRPTTIPTLTNT
jgi:hypothetical protein